MEDAVDMMGQGSSRPQYQMLSFIPTYLAFPTGSPASMPVHHWQLETWEGPLCPSL